MPLDTLAQFSFNGRPHGSICLLSKESLQLAAQDTEMHLNELADAVEESVRRKYVEDHY